MAKSFLNYNLNFYNDITEECFQLGQWKEAVNLITEAIEKVQTPEIIFDLKIRLVDCYENLNEFEEAFNTIYALFKGTTSYEVYKRTRYFAEKTNRLNAFINEAITLLATQTAYGSETIYMKVLSYEGLVEKLLDFIKIYKGYSRHEYLKYTSKALIYRAFHGEKVNLLNLAEYINSSDTNNMEGIVDLQVLKDDIIYRDYYLNSAVDMLKEMVRFHIDAVSRSRYERAAYYCSIVKDILSFLNREEEFLTYYHNLLIQNSRRPALKDEMKKRLSSR